MGCWEETCALTSAAIRMGDPCVMVRVSVKNPRTFDNKYGEFQDKWDFRRVIEIVEGEYNDYGDIEGHDRDDIDSSHNYFFTKAGWKWALEECKRIDDRYMKEIDRVLFDVFEEESNKRLELIIDRLVEEKRKNGEEIPPELLLRTPPRHVYPERINEFYLVNALCSLIRRPLCVPASGPQFGYEYRDTQLRYLEHVTNFVKAQKAQDMKDNDEWESDDDTGTE